MNASNKYKKDIQELRKQFIVSVSFIKELVRIALAKEFDDPLREEFAKSIAVKLRVLLIDGNSLSLVAQLGITDKILFSPLCAKLTDMPGNLIHSYGLVGERYDGKNHYYFQNYTENKNELRCTLYCWLDEVAFDRKQSAIHKVSRKDIILALADKEGGAHVDPSYEKEYYHIRYESGFEIVDDESRVISRANNNRFTEALLTIAQEFLEAANEYFEILNGSTYCECERDLSLVELVYEDKNIRKRYMHNQGKNIIGCFVVSYDYLSVARYRLIFSKNYVFFKNEKQHFLRVIDDKQYFDVLFCVCGLETLVFIKNNGKYLKVDNDDDLYRLNKLKHYTFSQAIRLIESKEHSNLDCLTKQKIYLENITKRTN